MVPHLPRWGRSSKARPVPTRWPVSSTGHVRAGARPSGGLLSAAAEQRRLDADERRAGPRGKRPCHGEDGRFARDPHWRELVLFRECVHGETGPGVGASHQTAWTALAARFIEEMARARAEAAPPGVDGGRPVGQR